MIVMLLLAALPGLLAFFITRRHRLNEIEELFAYLTWYALLPLVVPLLALAGGSAVAAEEISDRTITYVFTRPASRAAFFLGRFAASFVAIGATVLGSMALLALVLRTSRAVDAHAVFAFAVPITCAAVLGSFVYASLFAAAGARLKRPVAVGLAYVFAIEGLVGNFPGKTQELAVQHHLRAMLVGTGRKVWATNAGEMQMTMEPRGEALATLVIVAGLALLLGCWFLSRRQDP
jgi:hypothetical protein